MSSYVIVPEGATAIVFLGPQPDGSLAAEYTDLSDRVPLPRKQVAVALRMLASALVQQSEMLDNGG